MDILILSLVAGLIAAGGLWVASRDTKPTETHDDHPHKLVCTDSFPEPVLNPKATRIRVAFSLPLRIAAMHVISTERLCAAGLQSPPGFEAQPLPSSVPVWLGRSQLMQRIE